MEGREKNKVNQIGPNIINHNPNQNNPNNPNANDNDNENRKNKLRSFLKQMKTGENITINDRLMEKDPQTERIIYSK